MINIKTEVEQAYVDFDKEEADMYLTLLEKLIKVTGLEHAETIAYFKNKMLKAFTPVEKTEGIEGE